MRPSGEVNDLILGILGRGQAKFKVRIHAFVFLSNHWHGLLSVDSAAQLAGFVAFVNGNIAREIGRLHSWRQRFWGRRYRAIVVADETSAVARLRYILQNGCKEGFVDRPVDWPGLSCVRALTKDDELRGTWYDRTAEYNARRRGKRVIPGQFSEACRVELSPLPCWSDLSESGHRSACADIVTTIENETKAERKASGKQCLGKERILAMDPHSLPLESTSSPAPFVHASTPEERKKFRRDYAAFVDAYRIAAACLRRGERADFPVGAFPPPAPFIAPPPSPA
jgi:putative transposase